MANNNEFDAEVTDVLNQFSGAEKISYDDTPISRKGEIIRFPSIYPNEYRDNNLDEEIKNYKKELNNKNTNKDKLDKKSKSVLKNNKKPLDTKKEESIKNKDKQVKKKQDDLKIDGKKKEEKEEKKRVESVLDVDSKEKNSIKNISQPKKKKVKILKNKFKDSNLVKKSPEEKEFNQESIKKEEVQIDKKTKTAKEDVEKIVKTQEIAKSDEKNTKYNKNEKNNNDKININIDSNKLDNKVTNREKFNDKKDNLLEDSVSINETNKSNLDNVKSKQKEITNLAKTLSREVKKDKTKLDNSNLNNDNQESNVNSSNVISNINVNNKDLVKNENKIISDTVDNNSKLIKNEDVIIEKNTNNEKNESNIIKIDNIDNKSNLIKTNNENLKSENKEDRLKDLIDDYNKDRPAKKKSLFDEIIKKEKKPKKSIIKNEKNKDLKERNKEKTKDEIKDISEKKTNKEGFLSKLKNKIKGSNSSIDEKVFVVLVILVAVLFVFNIVLSGIVVFSIKNGGNKNITNVNNQITVNGDGITSHAVLKAKKSTVAIASGGTATDESSFYNKTINRGTGVIYKIDRNENSAYILTCEHIITGYENSVYILFSTYLKPIKVYVVGYSTEYDIAVLKVRDLSNIEGISEITSYNSQHLAMGESVFTVGNSLSGGLSASSGLISYINKKVVLENGVNREIQTDVTINPGNSGGGLFNSEGKLIGIISSKLSNTKSDDKNIIVEGVSYAIPGLLAINIAESIIKNNGKPTYIDIGVKFIHAERHVTTTLIDGKYIEKFEVRVNDVFSESVSNGIFKIDDIILSFKYIDLRGNLVEIQMLNEYSFDDVKFDIKPDSTIEFNINRPLFNEYKTLTITASNSVTAK